tara:strand:- start:3947 stop:5044 length:1098 start_codon:yes stop_codon:yes gene_type:complete
MNKIKLSDYGFDILQIESTAACNMACSFCPYPLKDDKTSKLNIEKIYSLLDQVDLKDEKFKYVTFSQFNEPLLDNRIFEILEYCNKIKFPFLFVTNGLLLNKKKNVENLIKYQSKIKLSLQVLDSTKHKDARGLDLELDRYVATVVEFCKSVKNTKVDLTIDLGCNFNENKFNLNLRKLLGIQTGDPSVPETMDQTMKMFSKFVDYFYNITDEPYKSKFENLKNYKDFFKKNNYEQEGYKIYDNVTLKLKTFFFGRRISNFYPINDNFACDSKILGVLADGNVVPCCLAYEDSISLGNIKNLNLKDVLDNGKSFLFNLRNKGQKKHETCKKCFGEPTLRGSILRNLYNFLPLRIKNSTFMNSLKE